MAGATKVGIKFGIDNQAFARLQKRLLALEPKAARKAIRDGVNEVSKLVLAEAKALVPKRTGQLRKSLGRKVKTFRGGAGVYAVVKPRSGVWMKAGPGVVGRFGTGRKKGKVFVRKFRIERSGPMLGAIDPVRYAHLVEFGRREVIPKKKKVLAGGGVVYGTKVKSVPPRPFLRPAWAKYERRAPDIILRYVRKAMLSHWLAGRG